MQIHATFATRVYDPDIVELVHAWDDGCVDENPSGYAETKKEALDSWGTDLHRHVTVILDVDTKTIEAALNPQVRVQATVQVPDQPQP